jgi:hypothetical protein
MTIKGYFVLGGTNPPQLPVTGFSGNHTGTRTRGQFVISTEHQAVTVNIPSRDKSVAMWAPEYALTALQSRIAVLDSEPGPNYRAKLLTLLQDMPADFSAVLSNESTSTHGSLALLGSLTYYGLHDSHTDTSYLFWGTPEDLLYIQHTNPLRYLLYRFPQMPGVFLPGEVICSKWWRWTRNASLLQAFNALEMRLNNGPAG